VVVVLAISFDPVSDIGFTCDELLDDATSGNGKALQDYMRATIAEGNDQTEAPLADDLGVLGIVPGCDQTDNGVSTETAFFAQAVVAITSQVTAAEAFAAFTVVAQARFDAPVQLQLEEPTAGALRMAQRKRRATIVVPPAYVVAKQLTVDQVAQSMINAEPLMDIKAAGGIDLVSNSNKVVDTTTLAAPVGKGGKGGVDTQVETTVVNNVNFKLTTTGPSVDSNVIEDGEAGEAGEAKLADVLSGKGTKVKGGKKGGKTGGKSAKMQAQQRAASARQTAGFATGAGVVVFAVVGVATVIFNRKRVMSAGYTLVEEASDEYAGMIIPELTTEKAGLLAAEHVPM
jgi:hypothetical protein